MNCPEWFSSVFSWTCLSFSSRLSLQKLPSKSFIHLITHWEVLSKNRKKKCSASKTSLANAHLTFEILLERRHHPRSWGQHCVGVKGFSADSGSVALRTCWPCVVLQDIASGLESGPSLRRSKCFHWYPFPSRNLFSKRQNIRDLATWIQSKQNSRKQRWQ